ncbi:hypothetical protein OC842_005682 [Tilletia horrida]|uniref:Carboxypeptidase n=1 Tax=Tilletia horrida TaxID=155126 RepID=A0AAN6JIS0_9BASI|nr:hypothetical protein OC842_005682 [Tilletia horrida]
MLVLSRIAAVLGLVLAVIKFTNATFANPKAAEYKVPKRVPGIPFALNDSYAGYVPVAKNDSSRAIYFWMFPAEKPTRNTILWLQGGPGCSGLQGAFQETGPFTLAYNSSTVVKNPHSWSSVANLIYVDQPIGTGLSKGSTRIKDETGLSGELIGFLEGFFSVFTELKGTSLWLAGESFGGKYAFYLADAIYNRPAAVNAAAGINLQGLATIDATLGDARLLSDIPSVAFAKAHHRDLKLSKAFLVNVTKDARKYGIYDYMDKHLTYPPSGPLPRPAIFDSGDIDYQPWSDIYGEAQTRVGPSFNLYNIMPKFSWWPFTDPLGQSPTDGHSADNFVNKVKGFKAAINADPSITYYACTRQKVFRYKVDLSAPPAGPLMNSVLERNQRTLIQHGLLDFLYLANGTRMILQNATWGGQQGFQSRPNQQLLVNGKPGGIFHSERKVAYIEYNSAGHQIPTYQPAAALKAIKYLIGDIGLQDLGK